MSNLSTAIDEILDSQRTFVVRMEYGVSSWEEVQRLLVAAEALDLTYDLQKRFGGYTLYIHASGELDTDG